MADILEIRERARTLVWIRKKYRGYMERAAALRADSSQNEPSAKALDAGVRAMKELLEDLDMGRHLGV